MLLALALPFALPGCFAPPGPAEQLSMSAYDHNMAMRFGRMDVAMSHVAAEAQDGFLQRHAKWGRGIRIVDVELAGMRLLTSESAEVQLTVNWVRVDESTMRSSAILQHWKQGKNNWELDEEIRVGGSPGIFDRHSGKKAKQSDGDDEPALPPADVNSGLL